MKNLSGVFLLVLGMFLLSGYEAGAYSRLQAAKDFPKPQFEEIFKNLWFYDTLYSIDNPELEIDIVVCFSLSDERCLYGTDGECFLC